MAVNKAQRDALKRKSLESGIPLSILIEVYERGQAAWLTGSRPGIGMAQWAMARVNSFLRSIGRRLKKHDLDLHEKVLEHRRKLREKRMGRG